MMPYGMKYPFGQFGSGVLVVFPPQPLLTPSLLVFAGGADAMPGLLAARQNFSAMTVLLKLHMQSTVLQGILWEKSTPSQPVPVH